MTDTTPPADPAPKPAASSDRVSTTSRDPSSIRRWLRSQAVSHLISPRAIAGRRKQADTALIASQDRSLQFFYQPGDAHSELASQALMPVAERYGLEPVVHLVPAASGADNAEPELLPIMAAHDARLVAGWYNLRADAAIELPIQPQSTAEQGAELRRTLGHYGSAMFYLGGEWYWGVDRLCHLERRLQQLGWDSNPGAPMLFPRPSEQTASSIHAPELTLECYASLRSPYTALAWPRARALAARTGVTLSLRPVLPMVMRGAPVSQRKGRYIFFDAAREARLYSQPFGPFRDPIGEPVRRAYRLLPELRRLGAAEAFFEAFLAAAFWEGINTASRRGFMQVLHNAGLPARLWQQAVAESPIPEEVADNQAAMYALPSWGVPTFRLLDAQGQEIVHAFGQDRLWLMARHIESASSESRSDIA